MRLLRAVIFSVWFYLTLAVVGLVCLPIAWTSRNAAISVIQVWARLQRGALRVICGVRTQFRGFETIPDGPVLIAMKHQGNYDFITPFLFLANPVFILKQELLKAPVFGIYCQRAGMIAIDREGGMKTMKQMIADAKTAAEQGRQVIIFPEGTRQPVDAPPDYKPGVAGLYRALDVPCVPVAINAGLVWPGSSFLKIRGGLAVFEALEPIPPGLSRDAFMTELENRLEGGVAKLVAEGRAAQAR
ncbi:MAG: lysophospholipid acyltransferase family protein [Hyphomonadaceae bacterium]